MNHNSLDEDRAPKPSNPETAYIHRHGQCCCGFYSKPGNAALRLQQGKAISRPMHVLQLKLELCISQRLVSLSKNTYFPTQPVILNKIDAPDRDTCKNSTAAPVHQHCDRPLEVWAMVKEQGSLGGIIFSSSSSQLCLMCPCILETHKTLPSCFIFSGHWHASSRYQWRVPGSQALGTVTIWHLPHENTSSSLPLLIQSFHWQKYH